MANDQIIFTLPDIGRLVRYPYAELSRERNQGRKPFSYYRRSWLYEAADELFRTRDEAAFHSAVEKRLAAGKGATKMKVAVRDELVAMLPAIVRLARDHPGVYIRSLYLHNPLITSWNGHQLKLPLGLLFEGESGQTMRLLWMERYLRPGVKGRGLTAAAIRAVRPPSVGPQCAIEPWFLPSMERNYFEAPDLESMLPGLDKTLNFAEQRRHGRSAA